MAFDQHARESDVLPLTSRSTDTKYCKTRSHMKSKALGRKIIQMSNVFIPHARASSISRNRGKMS